MTDDTTNKDLEKTKKKIKNTTTNVMNKALSSLFGKATETLKKNISPATIKKVSKALENALESETDTKNPK